MEINNTKVNVYGLLLGLRDSSFLSIQLAPSLETAFAQARLEFQLANPNLFVKETWAHGITIDLFLFKSIEKLTEENITFKERLYKYNHREKEIEKKRIPAISMVPGEVLPLPDIKEYDMDAIKEVVKREKNLLMKEIIENKDLALLDKNKKILSPAEIKYIKKQIGGDVQN